MTTVASKPFYYRLCLGDDKMDETARYITHVTFDISRYHKYTHTLSFEEPVTEPTAVSEVEKWFAGDADEKYYNFIKDNIWSDSNYSDFGENPKKYQFIGSCYFLDIIEKISANHIRLLVGS